MPRPDPDYDVGPGRPGKGPRVGTRHVQARFEVHAWNSRKDVREHSGPAQRCPIILSRTRGRSYAGLQFSSPPLRFARFSERASGTFAHARMTTPVRRRQQCRAASRIRRGRGARRAAGGRNTSHTSAAESCRRLQGVRHHFVSTCPRQPPILVPRRAPPRPPQAQVHDRKMRHPRRHPRRALRLQETTRASLRHLRRGAVANAGAAGRSVSRRHGRR